ncbi:MAG: divergent PAP2 family protein [Patescibacteria group bacterium]|jgi:acid phosphatase family membrane protein YuiD|nr:divergent PAP2 family protein [Patescibacteria group bacterium]
MENFLNQYLILICPIIAFIIAQGTKVLIRATNGKITFKDIFSYSDMPSGHTAVVTSLAAIVALREGMDSSLFAISFVFATIVIVDAIGLRNYLGQHGKTLNILVRDLKDDEFLDFSYPRLLEKIGHTPIQVLVGGTIGIITSLIGFWFFSNFII